MSRKHLFAVVVLLGAAAVAGLLALTRATRPGSAAAQTPSAQIAERMRSLDRLEASIRRSLAQQPPATPAAQQSGGTSPRTVYVRAGTPQPQSGEREGHRSEHEFEHAADDE
jgi:hypothetical protein